MPYKIFISVNFCNHYGSYTMGFKIYGGTAPHTPKSCKISMFCALSQNYQHLFLKKKYKYASYSKLSKELKNSIKIKVGQTVLELLLQNQHFDCFDL